MTDKQIPIVCDLTVFSADTREKLAQEVPDLFRRVQAVHELPDGYAFQFPNEPGTFMALANFVDHERQCCPFFHFTLQVSPGGGPLQLSMTGGEDVKAYMERSWRDLQDALLLQLVQTGEGNDPGNCT